MDTLDISLLLLRIACGATIAYHGYNKIFGPGGLESTASWFGSIGMKWPKIQARTAAGTELISGAALCLGIVTPLASAAIISLMLVAIVTVHAKVGFFIFLPNGGWEYCGMITCVATALSLIGPGAFSLDHTLGIHPSALLRALAIALGAVGAMCHVAISYRRPISQSNNS